MSLTPEQQAIRATGWGASEAAAVLGRSRYCSPLEAVLRKRGAQPESNEAMRWGHKLESVILDAYEEEMHLEPLALFRQPLIGTLRSASHPHVLCTPDARTLHVNVQAKSCRFPDRHEWGDQGTDAIPDEYLIQVQVEMGVQDLRETHVPVLFGGNDFRIYRVDFDADLFHGVSDRLERAWTDYIEGSSLPPIDGSSAYAEWLSKKFAERRDKRVEMASGELAKKLEDALCCYGSIQRSKQMLDLLSNELRQAIGDSYGLRLPNGGKVLWVGGESKTSSEMDWKAFSDAALLYFSAKDPETGMALLASARREATAITQRQLRFYPAKE